MAQMGQYHQFIDNTRVSLADTLRRIAPNYKTLSIATGYWDLAGTMEIIDQLEGYESIRLLIGKEPLTHRLQEKYHVDMNAPENLFPDVDIKHDLEFGSNSEEINALRETVKKLMRMIEEHKIHVKVYRYPRLHAKAYIFGNLREGNSVGIIGSSNFTRAGLTTNSELNFLTDDYKIVEFEPQSGNQENGHLTWFNDLWNADEAIDWTFDFTEILQNSPLGDYVFGPYDVYIRTLMEVFPDELIPIEPFDGDIEKILHPFQNQNALSLRRKLENMGVAMLSDSVGLGKTITASAIIKQYIEDGEDNIVILPPASLKQQWVDELQSERWNLVSDRDFRIISQQDGRKIDELIKFSKKQKNTRNEIDLFVIDEAHNLRNQGSTRHQQILELFQENPKSKVLLLTATPINNSLMDFANQIQLGSKGDLVSRKVPYISAKGNTLEYIDFFEALKRIQSEATKIEKRGEEFNWQDYKNTLITGIRHYLVRSTRQGVEKRNAMKLTEGQSQLFPKSQVEQFKYSYDEQDEDYITNELKNKSTTIFEGLYPRQLNLDLAGDITQRTAHPLDLFKEIDDAQKKGYTEILKDKFDFGENIVSEEIFSNKYEELSVIPAVFSLINFLGFVPYKPDTYLNEVYDKSVSEIRSLSKSEKEMNRIRIQLSIHNMLHVTWLKRLESSTATLLKSVGNYLRRLNLFEKWLDEGYIVSLSDASSLANEYDDNIDKAFLDYEDYLSELDDAISNGSATEVKKRGVERKIADESIYKLEQLRKDLERDKQICSILVDILRQLSQENHDGKLKTFANELIKQVESGQYGKKVLVFSFFSDTIEYLRKNLPIVLAGRIPNFEKRAAFVSGNSGEVENTAKRFSPISKKHDLEKGDTEIDFLFATDVLSEGQNLQDSGMLVNYDLHWNPVRMIQRNGRINRLGSKYSEILIANARPHADLELYLKLVRRLENKIATINNTVGNDQSILGEEANPIEFNDLISDSLIFSSDSETATKAMEDLENQGDILDWADSYSLELRTFLDEHDLTEIERLKLIPRGKWNYLSQINQRAKEDCELNEVLGLYTANGEYSATGEKIHDIAFVRIKPLGQSFGRFSSIQAKYIQEQDALELIKATPDDNLRSYDNIKVDRKEYTARGITEVKFQFEAEKTVYKIKPAGIRALEVLTSYFDYNLLNVIQHGIRRSNEKREFERIVLDINKQVRAGGRPYATTIHRFERFFQKLINNEKLEKRLEKVEGVLYYAKPE